MKKKLIIVNNDMHLGGVQKSLLEFLKEIHNDYDITLILFNKKGELLQSIPEGICIIEPTSFYHLIGLSQEESREKWYNFLIRGVLALGFRLFGRPRVMPIINATQNQLRDIYDIAISYIQNAGDKVFYGGCNDFVLNKINARLKVTFVHCDYRSSGSNNSYNNRQYYHFDKIATCSDGCKLAFLSVLPTLSNKTSTVVNCYDYNLIRQLSKQDTHIYPANRINVITVSRLAEEKGIKRAIYSMVNKKDVLYHIVGDGPQRESIKKLICELGIQDKIFMYGNQTNPYKFIVGADVLLIPSFHEAAPLVIDEARCLGVPVLSTNTTSSQDMIVDRKCGWVCENSQIGINQSIEWLSKEMIAHAKNDMKSIRLDNTLFREQFKSIIEDGE